MRSSYGSNIYTSGPRQPDVLKSPANRHKAVGFTYEQWRYVFTNTFDEADARATYDR